MSNADAIDPRAWRRFRLLGTLAWGTAVAGGIAANLSWVRCLAVMGGGGFFLLAVTLAGCFIALRPQPLFAAYRPRPLVSSSLETLAAVSIGMTLAAIPLVVVQLLRSF